MTVGPEVRDELRELLQAARAYLELERACGSPGLPLIARAAVPEPNSGVLRNARPQAAAPVHFEPPPAIAAVPPPTAGEPPPPQAALGLADRMLRLEVLAREAEACQSCVLHEKRTKSVFSRGSPEAEVAFVGEGPGRDEDLQGYPFVGAAGKLLDKMITAMGYGREDVYVCNVVKCRPPENRTPMPDEMEICGQFLFRQLSVIKPTAICALGSTAAKAILGTKEGVTKLRGQWHKWRDLPVLVTYHPSYLLRPYNQNAKREAWEDLKKLFHFVYD